LSTAAYDGFFDLNLLAELSGFDSELKEDDLFSLGTAGELPRVEGATVDFDKAGELPRVEGATVRFDKAGELPLGGATVEFAALGHFLL
jgi:hypothetical protein